MTKAFKAMGYAVQTQSLTHFYDDYGLKGDDDEELDEDEDEEDEDEDEDDEGEDSDDDGSEMDES